MELMEDSGNKRSDRQKELVTKLNTVHENLRRLHGTSQKDWNQVWDEHTGNLTELQEYSKAMYELATQVWSPRYSSVDLNSKIQCRIEWVYLKCVEYFRIQEEGIVLKLLDVGSCYNPFNKYKNIFDIVALDLCPAPGFEDSVYQCDFLQVPINSNTVKTVESKLVSLPRDYFDVVVFSFLLEYLPSQNQRLECCKRAADLLSSGGLLFIIRPDSNSMTAVSAKLTKQWKVGLSLLGLKRVYCEKLTHMWCTGYVKLNKLERDEFENSKRFQHDLNKMRFSEMHELFAISQDYKTTQNDEVCTSPYEKDVGLFDELPFGAA